jgi:DNA-binding response OmpR family regulator
MAKILVIDDEQEFRASLAPILAMQGYEMLECDNGARGIALARTDPPDLILCDVNMKGVNGHLTLHAVRHDPKLAATPFILMTGLPDNDGIIQAMQMGADGFLHKPFTPDELLRLIASRISQRRNVKKEVETKLAELRAEAAALTPGTPANLIKRILELCDLVVGNHTQMEREEVVTLVREIQKISVQLNTAVRRAASCAAQ